MAIVQRLTDNAPEIGGGVTGVGGTVAAREFLDINADGTVNNLFGTTGTTVGRLGRPSSLYGLGTGALALAGWWFTGRGTLNDFLLAHGITATPAGGVSALMPKQAATTAAAGAGGRTRTRTRSPSRARSRTDGGTGGGGVSAVGDVEDIQ